MQEAKVYMHTNLAGVLREDEEGYHFQYDHIYLGMEAAESISLTLPLRSERYTAQVLFPFFDGLIPEGWLLDIAVRNWKFDIRDRMSILLLTCSDCIGAVSVQPIKTAEDE